MLTFAGGRMFLVAGATDMRKSFNGSRAAVEPIAELTAAIESDLRRRHQTAPKAVWGEIEAMGVLYQRGEVFPYWPAWLAP